MFSTLRLEMRIANIGVKELAKEIGISESGCRKKLNGISDFTRKEMFAIKGIFPRRTFEELFSDGDDRKVS